MSVTLPDSERRVDRSPFADQALEKLLSRLRLESDLFAIVLADDQGSLMATSAQACDEPELEALGALSVAVQLPLKRWASLRPVERFQLVGQSGRHLTTHFFQAMEVWLSLTVVGDGLVSEGLLERAEAAILRILSSHPKPA